MQKSTDFYLSRIGPMRWYIDLTAHSGFFLVVFILQRMCGMRWYIKFTEHYLKIPIKQKLEILPYRIGMVMPLCLYITAYRLNFHIGVFR